MKIVKIVLTISFFITFFGSYAYATDYYVAPSGNDSKAGTLSAPWKTISKAAGTIKAGDTVYVRAGTYNEQVTMSNHGSANAWITFKNYPNEKPVLDGQKTTTAGFYFGDWTAPVPTDKGSYVEINGFRIRNYKGGIWCENSHHIRALNNIVEYSGGGNVLATESGCDYYTIENNIIRYNGQFSDGSPGEGWSSNISLNHKSGRSYIHTGAFHNFITNNVIYGGYDPGGVNSHTEGTGIIMDLGGDIPPTLIERNILFNNGRSCVNTYLSYNVWIIGNSCFKNCQDPYYGTCGSSYSEFTLDSPQGKVLLLGNIVYADKAAGLYTNGNLFSSDFNLYNGGTHSSTGPAGAHDIVGQDPKYANTNINCSYTTAVNPQGICASTNINDFKSYFGLQSSSPAIDKIPESAASYQGPDGTTQHILTFDFAGVSRPQGAGYDIGAYEYESTSPSSTSTPFPSSPISPTSTQSPCIFKKNGDADCKKDNSGKDITITDFEIWRKEFFATCSQANLSACGLDDDSDGSAMDANFNYPGSGAATTDTKVDLTDFEIWRKGYFAYLGITPTGQPTATPIATITHVPTPTPLPSPTTTATILWSTSFESGTIDQSLGGGSQGGSYNSGTWDMSIASDVAHSGSKSAKLTINADGTGIDDGIRLFRFPESESGKPYYYSAWYYIPAIHDTPGGWWDLFQFKSVNSAHNDPFWMIDMVKKSDGKLYLRLFDKKGQTFDDQSISSIPIQQWFQIEAYYKQSASNQGELTVWQNGTQMFHKTGITTMFTDATYSAQWSVNNYSDRLTPSSATIYVDDMAVSTTR